MSYALLDDCDASAAQPTSRLYTGWVREVASFGAVDVDAACAQVAHAVEHEGLHAVVLADYEWGTLVSDDHIAADVVVKAQAGKPALRFLLYARCERLSREQVDSWLAETDGSGSALPSAAGLIGLSTDTPRDAFDAAIAEIHAAIERGDTYQINYTYRLAFDTVGPPVALYRRLRARQPVRYGALIAMPDGRHILSCSPELFLRHERGTLHAQPMKGTAARVDDPIEDQRVREALAADPKNRAENLMIVDLLRNDIGRVAKTGSVSVPALFSVDAYGSVWQMTSTVQAQLRASLTFAQILRALFPCGSITGAPKHRAMEMIAGLEASARGLYTGSIGWLDAASPQAPCGDFCLSVAIRTLVVEAGGRGQMGVGAGIVLDSEAASEWEECKVKARFATELDSGIGLFETMRATRTGGVTYLDRHLARIVHSASEFGWHVDPAAMLEMIHAYVAMLSDGEHRVKLLLDASGRIEINGGPLVTIASSASSGSSVLHGIAASQSSIDAALPAGISGHVDVVFADDYGFMPTDANDARLAHKTTARETYDSAWRTAEQHGAFDMLFFNARGELTEGGRTNVFVRIGRRWYTPPLACGLLPGVMRGVLLEDPAWQATERVLSRDDVLKAEHIVLCNALRGPLLANLKLRAAPTV